MIWNEFLPSDDASQAAARTNRQQSVALKREKAIKTKEQKERLKADKKASKEAQKAKDKADKDALKAAAAGSRRNIARNKERNTEGSDQAVSDSIQWKPWASAS